MNRINFFVGPNGCGKSTYLYDKVNEISKENVLCLAITNSSFSKFPLGRLRPVYITENIIHFAVNSQSLNYILFRNLHYFLLDEFNYKFENVLNLINFKKDIQISFRLNTKELYGLINIVTEIQSLIEIHPISDIPNRLKYMFFIRGQNLYFHNLIEPYIKNGVNDIVNLKNILNDFIQVYDTLLRLNEQRYKSYQENIIIDVFNYDYSLNLIVRYIDTLLKLKILKQQEILFIRQNGQIQNLRQLSSGELTLLNIHFFIQKELYDFHVNPSKKNYNSVSIFIDEPENSLHPEWQRKYIYMLNDSVGYYDIRMYLATHSPTLVLGTLSEYNNDTDVYKVKYSELEKVHFENHNHNIEEILYNTFDLITPNNHYLSERISYLLHKFAQKNITRLEIEDKLKSMRDSSFNKNQEEILNNIINQLDKFQDFSKDDFSKDN